MLLDSRKMERQTGSGMPSSSNSNFTASTSTAEDVLKSQTVGLVNLSDFRKRRAEALESQQNSRFGTPLSSRSTTPSGAASSQKPGAKKRKKLAKSKGKLSFGIDDESGEELDSATSANLTPRSNTPDVRPPEDKDGDTRDKNGGAPTDDRQAQPRKLGPNTSISSAPKILTKAAMAREAQTREQLRREFLEMQEAVRATEISIPFVFYDGTNIPGGICRVKKGDHVWFFLDKARKVGAELGVGGGDKGKKEWARVSVDDLMLVRGDMIVPHHFEFYYFLVNKTLGTHGRLFDYSAERTAATPVLAKEDEVDLSTYNPLSKPGKKAEQQSVSSVPLEGVNDDPQVTKVVDRRWYERNKHIYPASIWEEFDPTKDYTTEVRKDAKGNTYFF